MDGQPAGYATRAEEEFSSQQSATRLAVQRAIDTMWEHYQQPISLVDLADAAFLSRFYFSRVFREITGTSPGRFLSAVRLYQAKTLLRQTSTSVTDISYLVGYNSVGTFTSRFTRSVGMTPGRYREFAQTGCFEPPPLPPEPDPRRGTVRGSVIVPQPDALGPVYVAAFNSVVPEGSPASCNIVGLMDNRYRLDSIPDGVWHVRAATMAFCDGASGDGASDGGRAGLGGGQLLVGTCPALYVRSGEQLRVDITLRESSVFDLPLLLALPELEPRPARPVLQAA